MKRRMFHLVTKTWNPITGCYHNCIYCWARRLAEGRLRKTRKYSIGFRPAFHNYELKRRFNDGEFIFVCDMGDMFGSWVPSSWIKSVIKVIRRFPGSTFLLLTKNPSRYLEFIDEMPRNVILGSTIETNNDELYLTSKISNAPLPSKRYEAMKKLNWKLKMISIEPILDFNLKTFIDWIQEIQPCFIYIGYDNYGCNLPEPSLSKTLNLIKALRKVTKVYIKTLR